MQTFLEKAAAHVFQQYSENLHRLVIILPTNRACFFFKRALAMQSDKPVWGPKILPIDDFITEAADATLVEPISLLWLLYDVCKEIDPQISFDRFTAWAHPLLQDFDKIDQYLVDTKELFSYLTKAKAIERWQPDVLPNRPFRTQSLIIDKYFRLWENLEKTYETLKDRLTAQKKAYRGMMYRWVAEHTEKLEDDPEVDKYIFVGLNALSHAEEKILKDLVKAHMAEVLWDTDSYYMEKNPLVKAGDLLRRYKKEGRLGSEWNWQTDDLLTQPKDIYITGVLNASMQGKLAFQIYKELLQEEKSQENGASFADSCMTAIVLPDENLLMPLLHSLDPEVEDFNITMGISLRSSALFTLVNLLFELQYLTLADKSEQKKTAKFNHRHVVKVLTHPFIKQYEQLFLQEENQKGASETEDRNYIRHTLDHIKKNNKVFLSPAELQALGKHEALFEVLFTPWNGDARKALQCFYRLIDLLRCVYHNRKDAIETEYLYLFYTIIKRLDAILEERQAQPDVEPLSLRSFKLFLYELFKQTKIPFSGEPVSQLQIMGMLETRTLDFENVIILSANEKTLPQAKKQNSLIPLDISLQLGLPTYRSQEATMSYHFYRLLQRAKKVYFLHLLPSDTYGAGEKSRFLLQIEHELTNLNPNIRLHYRKVLTEDKPLSVESPPMQIPKTQQVLDHLTSEIARGISPTQLNTFVHCSLQYYFSYLSNLKEEKVVQESMSADTFGNIVHKTLEGIDVELSRIGYPITKDDIAQVLPTIAERVKTAYKESHPGGSVTEGLNYLLYKVATRVIHNLLQHQIDKSIFPLEILGLEKTLSTNTTLDIGGKPVKVQLYGRMDRIDKTGNTIRIIDYKTGKVEKHQLKAPDADTETLLVSNPEADKVRQLWLYKYILAKRLLQDKEQTHELVAGIYSFRNIEQGLMTDQLRLGNGAAGDLEVFVEQSEVYLQKLVASMLDPEQPFARTTRLESCQFCPYTSICGRA
ncbi:PD-(D/E)XK nuclease family protein [Rhodocytophaga rosea]|uniref:PD-(D/E)XK nuclease family protein n=1 Tax=Rhodocytophaga rosea TaxID=2704465 RepID=A0A6C0GND7_9BACT|nr:PD-(D/E)XK nuclease family protein [Rhodocytophaga rosea]QHT69558.1 PD-(D/E)XK nuclease family protein [Rhodocytophaga rosea]